MKANLTAHLETMQHEISGIDLDIKHQGYRVDGEAGIKKVVGLNHTKSVDYFHIQNHHCRFIEFSDLARGQEDLLGWQDSLEQIDNKLHRNKFKKLLRPLLKHVTCDEMVTKFNDSTEIFNQIPEHYLDLPTAFLDKQAKTFFIVHSPINDALPDEAKAEIIRFLSTLAAKISEHLEDEICHRVKLMLLEPFKASLTANSPNVIK